MEPDDEVGEKLLQQKQLNQKIHRLNVRLQKEQGKRRALSAGHHRTYAFDASTDVLRSAPQARSGGSDSYEYMGQMPDPSYLSFNDGGLVQGPGLHSKEAWKQPLTVESWERTRELEATQRQLQQDFQERIAEMRKILQLQYVKWKKEQKKEFKRLQGELERSEEGTVALLTKLQLLEADTERWRQERAATRMAAEKQKEQLACIFADLQQALTNNRKLKNKVEQKEHELGQLRLQKESLRHAMVEQNEHIVKMSNTVKHLAQQLQEKHMMRDRDWLSSSQAVAIANKGDQFIAQITEGFDGHHSHDWESSTNNNTTTTKQAQEGKPGPSPAELQLQQLQEEHNLLKTDVDKKVAAHNTEKTNLQNKIDMLLNQSHQQQAHVEQIERELSSTHLQMTTLRQQLTAKHTQEKEEDTSLGASLEQHRNELAASTLELAKKENEIKSLEQKNRKQSQQVDEAQQSLLELTDQLNSVREEVGNLQSELEQKNAAIQTLEGERDEWGQTKQSCDSEALQLQQEINTLRKQLQDKAEEDEGNTTNTQQEWDDSQAKITQLTSQVSLLTHTIDELNQAVRQKDIELQNRQEVLEEREGELQTHQNESTKQCENLKLEIEILTQQLATAQNDQQQLDEKTNEVQHLSEMVSQQEQQIADMQTQLDTKTKMVEYLQQLEGESKQEGDAVEETLQSLKQLLKEKEEEIQELSSSACASESTLQEQQVTMRQLEEDIDALRNQLDEANKTQQDLTQKVSEGEQLTQTISLQENELHHLQQQLKERTEEVSTQDKKVDELQTALEDRTRQLKGLEAEHSSSNSHITQLMETVDKLEHETLQKETEQQNLQSALQEQQLICQQLEDDVNSVRQQLDDSMKTHQELNEKLLHYQGQSGGDTEQAQKEDTNQPISCNNDQNNSTTTNKPDTQQIRKLEQTIASLTSEKEAILRKQLHDEEGRIASLNNYELACKKLLSTNNSSSSNVANTCPGAPVVDSSTTIPNSPHCKQCKHLEKALANLTSKHEHSLQQYANVMDETDKRMDSIHQVLLMQKRKSGNAGVDRDLERTTKKLEEEQERAQALNTQLNMLHKEKADLKQVNFMLQTEVKQLKETESKDAQMENLEKELQVKKDRIFKLKMDIGEMNKRKCAHCSKKPW